jgi:O-antigen/teichoic acid export membrane protein
VVRGTALNLVGQVTPMVIGLITLPIIVRGLGPEAFGAFSVAWALLSYMTLFDFGLGRATTKFVAEMHGRDDLSAVRPLVGAAIRMQLCFGLVGALVFALSVPLLVSRVFAVGVSSAPAVRAAFYMMAAALPVLLVTATLSGVLEGVQRFDLVNMVRVPAGVASLVLPVVALWFGRGLVGVVAAVVLVRILALVAFATVVRHLIGHATSAAGSSSRTTSRQLLRYGGWIATSAIVSPLMVQMDRFFIGAVLSLSAVSYYAAPFDLVMRLLVVPSSLIGTLFPTFSTVTSSYRLGEARELLARSTKYLLLILGPVVVSLIVLARPGLEWLFGAEYAVRGGTVAQLLLLGVLINALGWIPSALLQGAGRPDLTAKLHLIELPAYGLLLWLGIAHFGIVGAAGAWVLRVLVDSVLLYGGAMRLLTFAPREFLTRSVLRGAALLVGVAVLARLAVATTRSVELHIVIAALVPILFGVAAWWAVLIDAERQQVRAISRAAFQR